MSSRSSNPRWKQSKGENIVLNALGQLIQLIDNHVIWLYAACLVGVLLYINSFVQARRERAITTFPIEKEIAVHREGRAMTGVGMMLGVVVLLTAVKFYVIPSVDLSELAEPVPTHTLPIPSVMAMVSPSPIVEATATTPAPIVARATAAPALAPSPTPGEPTATPPHPSAPCPDPNTRITSPGMNATVSGWTAISGTANHAQFQFYKVEYGIGEDPSAWHTIGDVQRSAVAGGQLTGIDTRGLPNGTAWFRLTVVDETGNFPPPCSVRLVIRN